MAYLYYTIKKWVKYRKGALKKQYSVGSKKYRKIFSYNTGRLVSKLASHERLEWNLKFWQMLCKLNAMGLLSIQFMKIFIIQFSTQEHCKLKIFKLILTFFRLLISKVLDKVLCFIIGREFCRKNFFYFFKKSSPTITFVTLVIEAR